MVRADVLVGQDNINYGRVLHISKDQVEFARGCSSNVSKAYAWNTIQYLVRDAKCEVHEFTRPAGGLHICDRAQIDVFKVFFNDQDAPVYATNITTDSQNRLHLTLALNAGSMHGPVDSLALVLKDTACPSSMPENPTVPAGYCYEPAAFAVNLRAAPITSNTILTQGFTVYVDEIGATTAAVSDDDIARAFGTALNLWTSGLLARRSTLEPQLKAYVDSVTGRGGTMTLFVPPQVVRVTCRDNATFVIRRHNIRTPEFRDPDVVALAQLEGRTILLNSTGDKYSFIWDLTMNEAVRGRIVNLTTVLAHEFGHALGLTHVTGDERSIMNPGNLATSPTPRDIESFIKILQQSIHGSTPGVLVSSRCAGLRLKPAR
jgi:hypothetical protein